MSSFMDNVNKLIKDAPAIQGGGNFVNFGPLKVTPMVITFKGAGNAPDKQTLQEYMEEQRLKEGDPIELGDRESFQLHFEIDVSEINPALDFKYQREVAVLSSNEKIKTDWDTIVLPSLVKVFGKDWHTKLIPNGSKRLKTLYVAAENVESLKPVKTKSDGTTGKNYGVPKFIALYEDAEACKEARDKRYPPRDEAAEMDYGEPDGEESDDEFTPEQLEKALTLFNSANQKRARTIKMLEKMFPKVEDHEALLDAALEEEE